MDFTNQSGNAWDLAALGAAISVYADRTANQPQVVNGQVGYGIDSAGNMYQLGTNATAPTVATPMPPKLNLTVVLLVIGALYLAHQG